MSKFSSSSLWLVLAGACFFTSANAQDVDGNHYDGTWTASLTCAAGKSMCSARVVIADYGGTWQDLSGTSEAGRLCGGKEMPLTVQSSIPRHLAFTVFGDGVSMSCPTLSIFVKPLDAKTLEGSVEIDLHAHESPEVHASHSAPSSGGAAVAPAPAASASAANVIRLQRR